MNPREKLLQHEELIFLVKEHGYIPQVSAANFNEVLCALREIDPKAKYDTGCSGCIAEIIRMADAHLRVYKASLPPPKPLEPARHTFPAHEKKPGRKKK